MSAVTNQMQTTLDRRDKQRAEWAHADWLRKGETTFDCMFLINVMNVTFLNSFNPRLMIKSTIRAIEYDSRLKSTQVRGTSYFFAML